MTICTQNNGTSYRLRLCSAAQFVAVCLCALALWGCAKPSENKDKPAADTPPVTQDPGSTDSFTITFSSPDKTGAFVTGTAFTVAEADGAPITLRLDFSTPTPRELQLRYSISSASTARKETGDITYRTQDEFLGNGVPAWRLTIPKGTSAFPITVAGIVGDRVYEGAESVIVDVELAGAGSRSVEFTIQDSSLPPSVKLELNPASNAARDAASITESAGTVTIHATLVGSSDSSPFPIRVPLTFSGTATPDLDYRNPGRFTPGPNSNKPAGCPLVFEPNPTSPPSVLIFPPGAKTVDFAVLINEDLVQDDGETAIITAHTPSILGPKIECGSLVGSDDKPASTLPLTVTIKDSKASGGLNPTGVTTCAITNTVMIDCAKPGVQEEFPNQDGKIASDNPPPSHFAPAGNTPCIRDTNTGLMWETKTIPTKDKEPLNQHYLGYAYTWFDNRENVNGGSEGNVGGENSCLKSISACNTAAYIKWVNEEEQYCGFHDWRLPTVKELLSLVRHGAPTASSARIDGNYFPQTQAGPYWTSTPSALYPGLAWVVDFGDGRVYNASKAENTTTFYYVRLVRRDQ